METITVTIHFEAGFAVQSGYGLAGMLDNTIMRDGRGLPWIPGPSLKGVIREACEEIALLRGHKLYEKVIDEIRDVRKDGKDVYDPSNYGPTTRIFGTPFIPAAFTFHTASLKQRIDSTEEEFLRGSGSWNESHTSISPGTGTAKEDHLFSMEIAAHDLEHPDYAFRFHVVPTPELVDDSLISFLFCAIRLVDHIGSGKTRGKGRVKMDLPMEYEGKKLEDWIDITFNPAGTSHEQVLSHLSFQA